MCAALPILKKMLPEYINASSVSAKALGDINGDGFADAIVGAIQYSSFTGRAYKFHSAGSSGIAPAAAISANTIFTGETINNNFGIL